MKQLFFLLLCFAVTSYNTAKGCTFTVPSPSPCPTAPVVQDGDILTAGNTYILTATASFASLSFQGGTLYVCGDLTLDAVDFRGGTIIVQHSATLTINDNNIRLDGDVNITNYGALNLNGNTSLQGSNNSIVNAPSGQLNSSHRLEINSSGSSFSNLGTANISELHLHSQNGGVCLGDGSETNLSLLSNNGNNSINGPSSGTACVSVSNNTIINRPLTAESAVEVCLASGIQETGGSGYGNATVMNDCSACGTLLATPPIYLSAEQEGQTALLRVDLEELPAIVERSLAKKLYLYRSTEGYEWEKVDSVEGPAIQSFSSYRFNYGLQFERDAAIYFRASLEIPMPERTYSSEAIHLSIAEQKELQILRQPYRMVEIRLRSDIRIESMSLFNYSGQLEMQRQVQDQQVRIDGQSLPQGIHIIRLQLSDGSVLTRRVVF